ncbi:virion protein [Photobacterium indicum]|uniref:virion protein n=1 Tax=Photobacterium indicum TaxID=81447 RepID=UPI001B867FD6|nr:virion protein [Photobacterium indicum]
MRGVLGLTVLCGLFIWLRQKSIATNQGGNSSPINDFWWSDLLDNSGTLNDMTTGSTVRGIRNKNPLNIEYNKRNNWLGQQGTDGRFCIFSDNKYGFRAGARVLRSYQRRGINTIHSIVHTFAPSHENETDHYANMVSEWMGISKHAPIDVSNDHVAANIIKAMARMEVGHSYPINTVLDGVKLA